jgi:hypothetical protein
VTDNSTAFPVQLKLQVIHSDRSGFRSYLAIGQCIGKTLAGQVTGQTLIGQVTCHILVGRVTGIHTFE